MNLRLLSVAAATAVLITACGPGRSVTTLPKLPVEASSGGATLGAAPAVGGGDGGGSRPGWYGMIEYRLGATLARLAATAPAYDLVAGSATGERVRIAAALGLAESDRHLFVGSGAGSWSYDATCAAPTGVDISGASGPDSAVAFSCASAATSVPAGGTACPGASPAACTPPKPATPVRPADLPSQQAATDRARTLFHALGVDVSADGLHVTDGITQWLVSADPIVGGLATSGAGLSATIGPKTAILAAQGFVGTARKLGDYPLVDAATVGFKRLLAEEAHRPRPMMAAGMPCRADVANCGEPLTPQVVTITGVHLALQHIGTKLVPVFIFEAGGNETAPPVPAVTDDLLLPTTKPPVSILPSPEPGGSTQPGGVAPGVAPAKP
jgi:hypothetical protein